MGCSPIFEISSDHNLEIRSFKEIWKALINSRKIEECLCRMFTIPISSIDNRNTRIGIEEESISLLRRSQSNNISKV